jgi:CRISPR-associated protein (TIGR02584 family)
MGETDRYRNIFLFVSGRTPQIITETLYFFLTQHVPPIHPHEIHVLTTTAGQALILHSLLTPRTGHFYRFCTDYRLNPRPIRFSQETIAVLRGSDGAPLADIRSDADNRAAADQIVAMVRTLTRSPGTRLFASMAGGRKTMGLYLGLALQLYGRPQDRLTHVLVSPAELENNPHFFYPSARRTVRGSRVSVASPAAAAITVAEVPLVLLGHKLPVLRERDDLSYAALVAHSQQEVDVLTTVTPLTLDRMGRRLRIGASSIPLSGLEFALYTLIARKRRQATCANDCAGCPLCTMETADFVKPTTIKMLEELAVEVGERDPRLRQLHWWTAEDEGHKRFLQVRARIKHKIRGILGEASRPYLISSLHSRGARLARYTILLNKSLLHIP